MKTVLLAIALAAAATPALAQQEHGGFAAPVVGQLSLRDLGSHEFGGYRMEPLLGVRLGYRAADRWSVEGALAGASIEVLFDPVPITQPPAAIGTTDPGDVLLLSLGASYTLARRGGLDWYLSGSVGRISHGPSNDREADPLVSVGTGALLHVWRPLFLRGDVKAYGHWCGRGPEEGALACDDGAFLGHYEASGGIQIVFHRYMNDEDPTKAERKEASP
jgi:hypothetical protein